MILHLKLGAFKLFLEVLTFGVLHRKDRPLENMVFRKLYSEAEWKAHTRYMVFVFIIVVVVNTDDLI